MKATRRTFLCSVGAVTAATLARPVTEAATRSGPRCYVAVLTPVGRTGRFDEELARDLLAFLQKNDVDGVVVLGTTGEFSSFSVSERKRILEVMIKNRGSLEILCHIGTPNLPETLDLLNHAAAAGADRVLVLPPFYYKNPSLEIEGFLRPGVREDPAPCPALSHPADQRSTYKRGLGSKLIELRQAIWYQGFVRKSRGPARVHQGVSKTEDPHWFGAADHDESPKWRRRRNHRKRQRRSR